MPRRLQRRRTPGYRLPPGAIYVGRPTPWGNPFPVANGDRELFPREDSVRMFRELVLTGETWFSTGDDRHHFARTERTGPLHVPDVATIRRHLAGRDLCCWCPLVDAEGNHVPCHADVLLEVANADPS